MKIVRQSAKNWNAFGRYNTAKEESAVSWQMDSTPGWFLVSNTRNIVRVDRDRKLKKSMYNITKRYDDEVLVYNTASEAIAILTTDEFDELSNFAESKYSYRGADEEFLNIVFDLGFVVYEEDVETSKIKYIINSSRYNTENIKSFVIYPTNECNARCFYCFAKEEVQTNLKMSNRTIADVNEFIKNIVSEKDEVVFRWFGGEPMMAVDVIRKIVRALKSDNRNIPYHSIMTTNGSLFTTELLEEAVSLWNLRKLHIPLDGFAKTHDRRKKYYTSLHKDEYKFSIELIKEALDKGIHVVCRLNLDKNNLSEVDRVIEDLSEFATNLHFFLHVTTLHIPEFAVCGNTSMYIKYEELNDLFAPIFEKMVKHGFYRSLVNLFPRRNMSVCEAQLNNHFLIGADGRLYACEQQNQTPGTSIGDCKHGVIHNKALESWYECKIDEECESCSYFPVCLGGCQFYRMRADGAVSPCTRFKHYSDSIFDLMMAHIEDAGYGSSL